MQYCKTILLFSLKRYSEAVLFHKSSVLWFYNFLSLLCLLTVITNNNNCGNPWQQPIPFLLCCMLLANCLLLFLLINSWRNSLGKPSEIILSGSLTVLQKLQNNPGKENDWSFFQLIPFPLILNLSLIHAVFLFFFPLNIPQIICFSPFSLPLPWSKPRNSHCPQTDPSLFHLFPLPLPILAYYPQISTPAPPTASFPCATWPCKEANPCSLW